jgi:hypothetical protein
MYLATPERSQRQIGRDDSGGNCGRRSNKEYRVGGVEIVMQTDDVS